jgi:hypothetical protein
MRWLQVGVTVLTITAMSGCPSEFGTDGRVNKAAHKDTQEHLLYITGCDEKRYSEVCATGKWDTDECLRCRGEGVQ